MIAFIFGAKRLWKSLLFLSISLALLSAATIAYAATYTISTTDSSVGEWASQAVPVFVSDATGDVLSGRQDEDIIEASVARTTYNGVDSLAFLVKFAGGTPMSQQYRPTMAVLDCNNNGNPSEKSDRKVILLANGDQLWVYEGLEANPTGSMPGSSGAENQSFGQRIAPPNGSYLEFQARFSDIANIPGTTCDLSGTINIHFRTAEANMAGVVQRVVDTTATREFNVPSAVTLGEMGARSQSRVLYPVLFAGIAGLVLSGAMGAYAVLTRRKIAQ